MKRSTIWAAVTILMITGPLSAQTKRTQPAVKRTGVGIPSSFQFSGWVLNGTPRKLSGKALAEHLAGRGATALQYGVKDLSVHRFKPSSRTKRTPGREFTLEVFRMDSAADAFGLFSFERRSTEAASARRGRPQCDRLGPRGPGQRLRLSRDPGEGMRTRRDREAGSRRGEKDRASLRAAAPGNRPASTDEPRPGKRALYQRGHRGRGGNTFLEPGLLGLPGRDEPRLCGAIRPRRQQAHRRGVRRGAGGAHRDTRSRSSRNTSKTSVKGTASWSDPTFREGHASSACPGRSPF